MTDTEAIQNLYVPSFERDACGVGCVVDLPNRATNQTIREALTMLKNMEHRGATGSDPETGDGAGILTQIPHAMFVRKFEARDLHLPQPGRYGIGTLFLPQNEALKKACRKVVNDCLAASGFEMIRWRKVPVNNKIPGPESKKVQPFIVQAFVKPVDESLEGEELERKLFVLHNKLTKEIRQKVPGENGDFYVASFSCQTLVYKGQLKTNQLEKFYKDLKEDDFCSSLAIIHSRFSTNTFPNWKLAQPFRYVAHNGEINTIRGNVNKMKSKEAAMQSEYFSPEEMQDLLPITHPHNSDSANLDALVELLTLSGRSLPHALMMLIPEAWQNNQNMDPARKAFYKFHASLIEPWDGPAAVFFTNGKQVGATLDRNGLRPVRFCLADDDRLYMASEAGTVRIDPKTVVKRGRLQPGKMLVADLSTGEMLEDEAIKKRVCDHKPYFEWIKDRRIKLRLLPDSEKKPKHYGKEKRHQLQIAYGYTQDDLKFLLRPMAEDAKEPIGSMGADTPLAVLSLQSQHVAYYFKQFFAQVSNPPIDPIRERLVMSLFTRVGTSHNILTESPEHTEQVHISQPILSHNDFFRLKDLGEMGYPHKTIKTAFNVMERGGLAKGLDRICREAEKAIAAGNKILILSNRDVGPQQVAMPSLLAVGAVHHHLIRQNLRTNAGIIVEAGDAWETHHFATLIGYGASAIYPFMAYESLRGLREENKLDEKVAEEEYEQRYITAVGNGLLKILSKMGISTVQSYQGAQIFECIGLGQEVIERCFKGTISRLEGLGFEDLEKECLVRHHVAFPDTIKLLPTGGFYQWRRKGERHLLEPEVIHLLQKSTKLNDYTLYRQYSQLVRAQQERHISLRSLLEFRKRQPIPLEEVEPEENIFKRFATGAMSFGSLSHEAHSTLAIAMNRIGGKSNSGEGGEDVRRFKKKKNGDWERSAIKQVASGRFGVTSYYLNNADEIQIKIAQGAKPGEGGQLPGHKVDAWIAKVRYATPGVGLISPPPHHDIYSIEDLKQLIFDLKNANPKARINVKLVAEAGVGTIASGVAKAKADVILISGADGGTGASPLSSLRHAGLPWEMGLSEAHQTLLKNDLRSRVVLQTDGKIMTGYDLAVATLLGAEEYGVSTAALIVEGCIMMRKCHTNTCPVGVATQDPELRKLFSGDPDHVVNLFTFIAREFREVMASLGFRSVDEMVGESQVLKVRNDLKHWKLRNLDLSPILRQENVSSRVGRFYQIPQKHNLKKILDRKLIRKWREAKGEPSLHHFDILNTDRAVGTMLSHEVSKKYGESGMAEDTFVVQFEGAAGQSFGAFLASGITFNLVGEANDYLGKGLSGGKLVLQPSDTARYKPEEHIITGNVAFYGATSGKAFINGQAGERFCVRNSGVEAVVEGIGDHGCEYMTGGKVVVLGETGQNFGAGMSGGIAYVYDPNQQFSDRINPEMIGLESLEKDDEEWLKDMLQAHVDATKSPLATALLADWKKTQKAFVKVMPNDLKRVLATPEKEAKTV